MASGAPVDEVLAPVDQVLFVKIDEDPPDSDRESFVHSEAFPVPVAGSSELFQLADYRASVLLFPLPYPGYKLLAAQVVAGDTLCSQRTFDHVLRCYSRMICAGEPKHLIALHPLCPAEYVLQGVVQRVADMQGARYVRRRDDY